MKLTRFFKKALSQAASLDMMAKYAIFLIQQRKESERALPYLHQMRELGIDDLVKFSIQERDGVDSTLQTWLDHHQKLRISSWVLATWLLIDRMQDKRNFTAMKCLWKKWLLNHTQIEAEDRTSSLRESSWYLLGYVALKMNELRLAYQCFVCVQDLPEETRAITLSLVDQADSDIMAETEIEDRRYLVQAKFLSI